MTHPRLPIRRLALLSAAVVGTFALIVMQITTARAFSTQVLRISARSHMVLRFTLSQLHAHPGRVTILMTNPSSSGVKHGIAIAGHAVGPIVRPGHTASVSVSLTRGSYTYYCPVKGHRAAGMKGILIVS